MQVSLKLSLPSLPSTDPRLLASIDNCVIISPVYIIAFYSPVDKEYFLHTWIYDVSPLTLLFSCLYALPSSFLFLSDALRHPCDLVSQQAVYSRTPSDLAFQLAASYLVALSIAPRFSLSTDDQLLPAALYLNGQYSLYVALKLTSLQGCPYGIRPHLARTPADVRLLTRYAL